MRSIEDFLELLDNVNWNPPKDPSGVEYKITDRNDRRVISDFSNHTRGGRALSTAQGELSLKLMRKYAPHVEASGWDKAVIEDAIANPVFRLEPYQSTVVPREVRWIGNQQLVFRSKLNAMVKDDIKRLRADDDHKRFYKQPTYVSENKLWVVEVNPKNYDRVMDVIGRHNFAFDDDVAEFLAECANSIGAKSHAQIEGESIRVECRNDPLLTEWLNSQVDPNV